MKRILWLLAFLVLAAPVHAADNVAVTPGSGKTMACLDISTVCFSKLIVYDTSGNALFASGNAGYIRIASGGVASGAYASGAFASGAFASGSYASGAFATGSMVDLLTFQGTKAAGTAAANSALIGGVYNSSPLTLTTGQQSSLQFDANGYAKVNVAAGGAGGGVAYGPTAAASSAANPPVIIGGTVDGSATGNVDNWKVLSGVGYVNCSNCSGSGVSAVDEAAFTYGTTPYAATGGFYQTTATNNPLTNGQAGAWQMTANRAGFVNMRSASGTEEGTSSNPLYIDTPAGGNLFGAVTSGIPSQSPTVGIGGVGILDGVTPTIVATVKAASTLPVAADKTLVVGLNPGTATAGSPTGAIISVQGVSGGTAQPVVLNAETTKVIGTVNQGTSPWVVSNGGTFAVQSASTLAAETTKVIGTVNQGTSPWVISGALTANQSVNAAQVNGITTLTGTGATGTGAQRVTVAVDSATNAGSTPVVGSGTQATANRTTLATDSPGIVTLGGATPANSVPVVGAGFTYSHISTATTTTVKSGAGVVHTITVNNLGTVASTTTVYDNTAGSGTVMAVINTLAGQVSYVYDVAFATGLTLVTTGTVAPDITVSYR
jgi:hypothetical protein